MRRYLHIISGIALAIIAACSVPFLSLGGNTGVSDASSISNANPDIYGTVILADTEEFDKWGIYNIPSGKDEEFKCIIEGAEGLGRGSGVGTPSTYIAIRYYTFYGMSYTQVYTYDVNTWEQIGQMKSIPFEMMAYDLSYDPISEQVYGCFYVNGSDQKAWFGTADYATGKSRKIADIEKWNVLAFDMRGQAYAIDMKGNLLKVDKNSGTTTLIGFTGVVPRYPSSGTIDPETGILYWNVCPADGHSYLYTVDLSNAHSSKLMQFEHDEQVMGMYIPFQEALEGAPDKVTDLELDFPKGSMAGEVSFRLPTKSFGGIPLSGTIEWTLSCEGGEDKAGSGTPGEIININYSLDERGEYVFCVTASNEIGISPRLRKSVFIGNGIPASTSATLSFVDGIAKISWDPVTESRDGGYFDPAEVRYRVRRLPDNIILEANTESTSIEISLPEPDGLVTYYFEITPIFEQLEGDPMLTSSFTLGAVTPPYEQKFDNPSDFDTFTVIDGNSDGKTWEMGSGFPRLFYSDRPADDWLITPALNLTRNEQYSISFDVRNSYGSFNPERLEVMMGEEPSCEAMNHTLLAPTVIENETWKTISFEYIPSKSGKFYIGFHGISDPNMFWIGIDNVTVRSGRSTLAPASSKEIKAIADINGGDFVDLSFKAPGVDISGNPLEKISRIEIFRNEDAEPIKVFNDVNPEAECEYHDSGLEEGAYTYSVTAYNEHGAGVTAVVSTFVGINVPGEVTDIKLKEIGDGEISISWNSPMVDRDGYPINPAFVSYKLVDIYGEEYVTANTSEIFQTMLEEEQDFVRFGISAFTKAGESPMVYSEMTPMGKPYETPYRDSFNNNYGGILGSTKINGEPKWNIGYDGYFEGIASQDGDDAFIVMEADSPGDAGAIYTGKISLKNCVDPSMSVYVYQFTDGDSKDDENILEVEARVVNEEEYVTLGRFVNNTLPLPGWNRLVVSLKDFENEVIQIRLKATANSYACYLLDNLIVTQVFNSNIGVMKIDAPTTVLPDEEFEVNVEIENLSLSDADRFTVELLSGREIVDKIENLSLAQGQHMTVNFTRSLSITESRPVSFMARTVWKNDEYDADNELYSIPISVVQTNFPKVDAVRGSVGDSGTIIEWDALDMTKFDGEVICDSFEDYEPFSMNPGGEWKFVDLDKARTAIPQDIEIDGIGDDRAYAFVVMNSDHPALNGTFKANRGKQYLMAAYAADQNDDWAISPRLSGAAQTISFYARNYYEVYGREKIEVRYSTAGNSPEDFKSSILSKTLEGNQWEYISVDLPAGATYVAIHYVSNDQYMLFVDDFSYIPAPWSERVNHIGYNIYRNGKRLNSVPLNSTSYIDSDTDKEINVYHLTAVYEEGESSPSEPFIVDYSGVSDSADTMKIIYDSEGIKIVGASGKEISVYTLSGICVANIHDASDFIAVPLAKGVYVIRIDSKVWKIMIK